MVMKIKFNLDDKLRLNKTIEISGMIIALRAIFLEKKKTNITHKFSLTKVCVKYEYRK